MTTEITTTMFIQIGGKRYQVATFEHASVMFCRARDAYGEGGSRTPTPLIVDEHGAIIGYVSYNGRVWPGRPKDWKPETKPLFDNRTEI